MNYFQNACKLFVKSHNSVLFSTVCFRYADRLNTSCADKKAVIQCQLGQSRIFIILGALDFIFQARIETAQLRKIKRSLIFGKWLIILLRTATHASLCYSGLQPKIQIYNRILYHLGSLYLQLFSTPLFHDLEVVCIYICIYKYDSPVPRKNSVFHSTHSLQAYSKNRLLCTSNPLIAG